ncbi:MAG: hypothetical protein ACRC0X_04575 [Brevinema sp.]
MKKTPIILFLYFFSSCGLEVPQPIPRLYSPNGIRVENVRSGTGVPASTIRVRWYGINPEEGFSGYNIYYTDNFANALNYKGTKILCLSFNPKQATLPIRPPFNVVREFSFDVTKFYYANQGELFTQGKEYWFFVTAYNQVRNLESPPSYYGSIIFEDNLE